MVELYGLKLTSAQCASIKEEQVVLYNRPPASCLDIYMVAAAFYKCSGLTDLQLLVGDF